MATVLQIASLALQKLNVIGAGETAASADNLEAQNAYARLYALLAEDGWATWPEATIPEYIEDAVADCIAARVRPMFSAETAAPSQTMTDYAVCDAYLKSVLRRKHTQAPTEMQDF